MGVTQARGLLAPLFVPADRPERFAKAAASGADAIIVDLEDAVAPVAKDGARDGLAAALPPDVAVVVRVNAAGTPWHDADVALVARHPGLGLMLPKAEDAASVARLAARIGADRLLVALVESAPMRAMRRCSSPARRWSSRRGSAAWPPPSTVRASISATRR
jgi:citrate lyase subunit beta/citryl-CoA lyase